VPGRPCDVGDGGADQSLPRPCVQPGQLGSEVARADQPLLHASGENGTGAILRPHPRCGVQNGTWRPRSRRLPDRMNVSGAKCSRPVHHCSVRQLGTDGAGCRHHDVNAAVVEPGQAVEASSGEASQSGSRPGCENDDPAQLLAAERAGVSDHDAAAWPLPAATLDTPAHCRIADRVDGICGRQHAALSGVPSGDPIRWFIMQGHGAMLARSALAVPPGAAPCGCRAPGSLRCGQGVAGDRAMR
jgi:hypothetical protein